MSMFILGSGTMLYEKYLNSHYIQMRYEAKEVDYAHISYRREHTLSYLLSGMKGRIISLFK